MSERLHIPVLLAEVIENINIINGGVYADLTFGEGGHTEAFIKRGAKLVVATDRDSTAVERYRVSGEYRNSPHLTLLHTRFSEFADADVDTQFDGILIDLGVSTRQLLEAERGFSFAASGPLDMRMDPSSGESLREILDSIESDDLANAIYRNTDLRESRKYARKILNAYQAGEIQSTSDLAKLFGPHYKGTHPATVAFLALRMLVNDEMGEIEKSIPKLIEKLKPGGRLAVITFHSTEDRLVKVLFNTLAGKCVCGDQPCKCPRKEIVKLITKKPVEPSEEELRTNPRSRSAKLRVVEKI